MTKQEIQDAINAVMDERRRIDEATHEKHHQFVEMQIEKYKDKKDLKKKVIGGVLIAALGTLCTAAYQFAMWMLGKMHG